MTTRVYSDSFDTVNEGGNVAPGTATVANTNILSTNYRPKKRPCLLRVSVTLQTGSVFNVMVDDGTTARPNGLNDNNALTGDAPFTADFEIEGNALEKTVNFQTESNDTITQFEFREVNEVGS